MASFASIKTLLARGYFRTQRSTLPLEHPDLHPEILLWRGVIDMALRDIASGGKNKKEALAFFDPENTWFQKVCYMAFVPEEEAIRMSVKISNIKKYETRVKRLTLK